MTKELLTLAEFTGLYSISRATAYRESDAGRLQFTKVGRRTYVHRVDADMWLKSLRPEAYTPYRPSVK